MALALSQSLSAVAVNTTASFLASGGTEPYAYEVLPGGAGGTIDETTGVYTAPAIIPSDPANLSDTIQVTDDVSATATAQIVVGSALLLFCEILQQELGLANGRVYLWDQKIMQPTDSGLYVAVSMPHCKPFSNITRQLPDGVNVEQIVNMAGTIDVDIISRGPAARDRKEEVILAFNSIYAQTQQEANGFYIGKLPPGSRFLNLSEIDGAAIPYRYRISVILQYAVRKVKALSYIDQFQEPTVYPNP